MTPRDVTWAGSGGFARSFDEIYQWLSSLNGRRRYSPGMNPLLDDEGRTGKLLRLAVVIGPALLVTALLIAALL